jgi:hypothetical protein
VSKNSVFSLLKNAKKYFSKGDIPYLELEKLLIYQGEFTS